MIRLTFSVIFGLILISGKPCYSDSTEKISMSSVLLVTVCKVFPKEREYLIWQDNLKVTSGSS